MLASAALPFQCVNPAMASQLFGQFDSEAYEAERAAIYGISARCGLEELKDVPEKVAEKQKAEEPDPDPDGKKKKSPDQVADSQSRPKLRRLSAFVLQ